MQAEREGTQAEREGTDPASGGSEPEGPRHTRRGRSTTVGVTGLEPATFRPPDGRATKLRHTPPTGQDTLSDERRGEDSAGVALLPPGDLAVLRRAVAGSTSWRGVLRFLGRHPGNGRVARRLRGTCDDLGIDYSHFGGPAPRWSEDDLRTAAVSAVSWPQLLRRLGYAEEGGSARGTVRAHAARFGVDLSDVESPTEALARPGVGALRPEHLRTSGSMLVAAALSLEGFRVSWPLEPAPYDLLADLGTSGLRRVQVKTTTQRRSGSWVCHISRSRYDPDSSGSHRRLAYDPREIDDLAVVDGDLTIYLVPYSAVAGLAALHLRKYSGFAVSRFALTRLGRAEGPLRSGSR